MPELLATADLDAEAQHLTRHDGQLAVSGGECVVNPSGGLLAKWLPVDASGGIAAFDHGVCAIHIFEGMH